MRQNFVAQFVQLLKCWLCDVWLGVSWRRIGPFLLINAGSRCCSFLSISLMLFRCNGFAGIQKAVVDQIRSRPTMTMTFFGGSLALGSALELLLSPITELVIASCYIKSTFCCILQSDREMVCCCCIE